MSEKGVENSEFENLDNLEKEFNNVIASIMQDDNLSKFKDQYQLLLNAFKESHENNAKLIERCSALNAEIVANSTKVNSVLKVSQDDERTIAGLKFEFEKAWKMVELAQDKENKSRELIEQLKAESQNLSKLAEQGGTLAYSQENSLSTMEADVRTLRNEIALQKSQIDTITGDNQGWKDRQAKLKEETAKLSQEYEELTTNLSIVREEAAKVEEEVSDLLNQTNDTKNKMKESHDIIKANQLKSQNGASGINELKNIIENQRMEIRDDNEQRASQLSRVDLVRKLLENRKASNEKAEGAIVEMKEKLDAKDEKRNRILSEGEEVNSEHEKLEKELAVFVNARSGIQSEIKTTRDRLNACRGEVYRLQHELMRGEGSVNNAKRALDISQRQTINLKSDEINERKNMESIEHQTEGVWTDISNTKGGIHGSHKRVENLLAEIEKSEEETSHIRASTMTVEAGRKINEEAQQDLERQLNILKSRLAKHETQQKTLLEQRDLTRRQLEALKQEARTITDNNLVIANEIASSKEQIRHKDLECVSIHQKIEEIREVIPSLEKETAEFNQKLKNITMEISTANNTLVRTRYLSDVAEGNLKEIQIVVKSLKGASRVDENLVNNRYAELNNLKEKIVALQCQIKAETGTYFQICDRVTDLRNELIHEVEIQRQLLSSTQHMGALKKECIKLEKTLLRLQGQTRALEDELETPMHIHRWRFLEGTNPELMNLIKMTHSLRDSLMLKLATIQRLRDALEREKKKSEQLTKHIQKTTIAEQEAQREYYESVLQTKQRQLKVVERNVEGQKSVVDEGRESLNMMRTQLRDAKMEYFQTKAMTDSIRASSGLGAHAKVARSAADTKVKYIGGGFSTLIKEENKQPMSPSLRANIVCPTKKASQSVSHLLPRKPLPALPVVN